MSFSRAFASLLVVLYSSFAFAQAADLGVEKLGPAEAPANSDVTYTVTIFNAGPDDATNAILSDLVPAGMSFVSATQNSGPTFTCDATVSCTNPLFAAGASASFTFVFHIDSGTQFTNTAAATSSTADPNSENDTASAFTTVTVAQGDLSIQKTAAAATTPDDDVTFFITLTNAGPSAAANVVLTDNLPAPLTFVSFTQTTGPAMSCGTSSCTVAAFAAGATATFELTGHVPSGTPPGTEITNTASVASDNDPNDENNVATTTVTVSSADVRVEKTGPPAAVAGTTIQYDVTVTNDGPDPALNVQVLDPQLCASIDCSLETLAPGASVVLTGYVTIPPDATSWSNTATVTTDSFDPNSANDTDTVTTTITQSADVAVEKTGPATIAAGSDITWTVTVTNNGPSDASNVSVTDALPAGVTFVSSTCGTLSCDLGTLPPSQPAVLTFTGNVPSSAAAGTITNGVAVTSSTPDPNSANNSDTADAAVNQSADVSVLKTGPATVAATADITWTITVTNNGPSDAANVILDDTLPAGTTLVSSTCGPFPCALGTLAPAQSTVVTLIANVSLGTTGTLTNTATVTTTTPDPTPGNDTSSTSADVTAAPADLSITKTPDTEFVLPGGTATYTIVVSNAGPGEATDVVVTDTLPDGMTLVSSPANCTGSPTVTCTVGTLAAGDSATIELVVTLPGTPGPVTNTATVSASTPDPASANDSGSAAITVSARLAAIPMLSPLAMALLALSLAVSVIVVLRRV